MSDEVWEERNTPATGHCLCGAVRFSVSGELRDVKACHCKQCQRATGSYVMATKADHRHIELEDTCGSLTWFRDPNGDWARRGFCNLCGSNLFWQRDNADAMSIMAGAFDEPNALILGAHIYVADKGHYYRIGDDVPQYQTYPND